MVPCSSHQAGWSDGATGELILPSVTLVEAIAYLMTLYGVMAEVVNASHLMRQQAGNSHDWPLLEDLKSKACGFESH